MTEMRGKKPRTKAVNVTGQKSTVWGRVNKECLRTIKTNYFGYVQNKKRISVSIAQ